MADPAASSPAPRADLSLDTWARFVFLRRLAPTAGVVARYRDLDDRPHLAVELAADGPRKRLLLVPATPLVAAEYEDGCRSLGGVLAAAAWKGVLAVDLDNGRATRVTRCAAPVDVPHADAYVAPDRTARAARVAARRLTAPRVEAPLERRASGSGSRKSGGSKSKPPPVRKASPPKPSAATNDVDPDLACVISDIHWPHPFQPGLDAFYAWRERNRPGLTIVDGDAMDMECLSRFDKTPETPVFLVDEIKQFVAAMAAMAATGRVVYVEGNHDRYERTIFGMNAFHLKGLVGLTLEAQCRAQGLPPEVGWYREDVGAPGIEFGQFLIRHGHRQAQGRFGAGVNVATLRLNKSMGRSEIIGHHHVAQLACRSAHGRTASVIVNPCMSEYQSYAGSDVTWQRGFTILERVAPDWATAYPIVMDDRGRFRWGGVTYGEEG